MAKRPTKNKVARLNVRYGRYVVGETIRGTLAEELIGLGMADDITPPDKPKKKAAKSNKNAGAAPENKAEGFDLT